MTDNERKALESLLDIVCSNRKYRYCQDSHCRGEAYCIGLTSRPNCEYQCIKDVEDVAASREVET